MKTFEQFMNEATNSSRIASMEYVRILQKLKKSNSESMQSYFQSRLNLLAQMMNTKDLQRVLSRTR